MCTREQSVCICGWVRLSLFWHFNTGIETLKSGVYSIWLIFDNAQAAPPPPRPLARSPLFVCEFLFIVSHFRFNNSLEFNLIWLELHAKQGKKKMLKTN